MFLVVMVFINGFQNISLLFKLGLVEWFWRFFQSQQNQNGFEIQVSVQLNKFGK